VKLVHAALLFAAVGAGACDKKTAPSDPAHATATASARASAASQDGPLDRARKIALSPPPGSSGIDQRILETERALDKNPVKADLWVLLGRA